METALVASPGQRCQKQPLWHDQVRADANSLSAYAPDTALVCLIILPCCTPWGHSWFRLAL